MPDLLDRLKTALADRYAIEQEIGAGGMATVYLAEDLKLHRKVAVKVLRPELAAVLGAERFVQENINGVPGSLPGGGGWSVCWSWVGRWVDGFGAGVCALAPDSRFVTRL